MDPESHRDPDTKTIGDSIGVLQLETFPLSEKNRLQPGEYL